MEALLSFIPNIPASFLLLLILGTNVKKIWYMEAKEDRTIVINKYRHRTIRQVEFIVRALVFGIIIYFLNDIYLENFLNWIFSLLLKTHVILSEKEFLYFQVPCVIFAEFVLTSIFYDSTFKKGLIGMDMSPHSKSRMVCPIIFVNMGIFVLIYMRLINVLSVFLLIIFIAFVLLYCIVRMTLMRKHEIFRFFSGSRYSSTEQPLLHKDIYLNLKNKGKKHKKKSKKHIRINLLENNLYICDNDDILVLNKCGTQKIYYKEEIKSLQIKNDHIVYKDGHWVKRE